MRNRCRSITALLPALLMSALATAWAEPDPDLQARYEQAGVVPSEQVIPAPDFELAGLRGEPVRLADSRGSLVLLNFWATWCGPCVKEMPALERLAARFTDKELRVLAVSLDMGDPRSVEIFVQGYGWKLPILLDPLGDVSDQYQIRAMPTTYLISPDGHILGRALGPREWDNAASVALFEALLETP